MTTTYLPTPGLLSPRRLTVHGAIVYSLAELARLAGEAYAAGVEDDISGPTSGLEISDALDQVVGEINALAPAGWQFEIDENNQPGWLIA